MMLYAVFYILSLYRNDNCTNTRFPRVVLTNTLHNIVSKPLAAFFFFFHLIAIETMYSGERGIES